MSDSHKQLQALKETVDTALHGFSTEVIHDILWHIAESHGIVLFQTFSNEDGAEKLDTKRIHKMLSQYDTLKKEVSDTIEQAIRDTNEDKRVAEEIANGEEPCPCGTCDGNHYICDGPDDCSISATHHIGLPAHKNGAQYCDKHCPPPKEDESDDE
jgi:hypothetical protein